MRGEDAESTVAATRVKRPQTSTTQVASQPQPPIEEHGSPVISRNLHPKIRKSASSICLRVSDAIIPRDFAYGYNGVCDRTGNEWGGAQRAGYETMVVAGG